ncbi:hypothetical protein ONZ45_g19228 [Pleurotus djamor]|nr:hypothetical protein ONZ45_g19228 [Pleurotus djamor]
MRLPTSASFGPLFAGYYIATTLSGVIAAQAYMFNISPKNSQRADKIVVYTLLGLEVVTTVYSSYATYVLGIHLSHPEAVPGSYGLGFSIQYIAISK